MTSPEQYKHQDLYKSAISYFPYPEDDNVVFSTRLDYLLRSEQAWQSAHRERCREIAREKYPNATPHQIEASAMEIAERSGDHISEHDIEVASFPIAENLDIDLLRDFRVHLGLPDIIGLDDSYYQEEDHLATHGLELELGYPTEAVDLQDYLKYFDYTMQAVGSMLCFDNLREVALPPSGETAQIAGMAEMVNLGLITKDQEIFTHLNISTINNPERYLKQIFLIHLAISSSSFYQSPDPDFILPKYMNKELFEDANDPGKRAMPRFFGLPIRFKKSDIIEFRLLQTKWHNFDTYKAGYEAANGLITALSAYSRVQEGQGSERDQQLSQLWETFEEEYQETIQSNLIDSDGRKSDFKVFQHLEAFLNYIKLVRAEFSSEEAEDFTQVEKAKEEFLTSIGVTQTQGIEIEDILDIYRKAYSPGSNADPEKNNHYYQLERIIVGSTYRNRSLRRDIDNMINEVRSMVTN